MFGSLFVVQESIVQGSHTLYTFLQTQRSLLKQERINKYSINYVQLTTFYCLSKIKWKEYKWGECRCACNDVPFRTYVRAKYHDKLTFEKSSTSAGLGELSAIPVCSQVSWGHWILYIAFNAVWGLLENKGFP